MQIVFMGTLPINAAPADSRVPEFRWLLEHAGWQVLPAAPGDDVQGPDVRERIGRNGVVFSAYKIPRGSPAQLFGQVDLEPLPKWASSLGIFCTMSVGEILETLRLDGDPDRGFRSLNSHLEKVEFCLRSGDCARTMLRRHIDLARARCEIDRSVLRDLRREIGHLRMIKGLMLSAMDERRHLARYHAALSSLDEGLNSSRPERAAPPGRGSG